MNIAYDENISKHLSLLKKEDVTKDGSIIYQEQFESAVDIVKSFTETKDGLNKDKCRNNHIILASLTQSGKTDCVNTVANLLTHEDLSYFMIKNFYFVTAMNDNQLCNQTYERLKESVIYANDNNICKNFKNKINDNEKFKFYILKNSDLKKQNDNKSKELKDSIIFIDESHYGNKKNQGLDHFLNSYNIDLKNDNSKLKNNNILIVSISATPFEELLADVNADSKPVVILKTGKKYVGYTKFEENNLIHEASYNDFYLHKKNDNIKIIEYIESAYNRMLKNNERGIIFIRANNKKQDIKNNLFIKNNFEIVNLDTSINSAIDYEKIKDKVRYLELANDIKLSFNDTNHLKAKPIIFFIKGAFRAGITIDENVKDLVYMIYDNSTIKEATIQGLLGRMTGYRNTQKWYNTFIYINKEQLDRVKKIKFDKQKALDDKAKIKYIETDSIYDDKDQYIEIDNVTGTMLLESHIPEYRVVPIKFENIIINNDEIAILEKSHGNIKDKNSKYFEFIKSKNIDIDYLDETKIIYKNNEAELKQWRKEAFDANQLSGFRIYDKDEKKKIKLNLKEYENKILCHCVILPDDNNMMLFRGVVKKHYKVRDLSKTKIHETLDTNI